MPISLVSQPQEVAFARNPVIWKFRCLDSSGQTFSAKGATSTLVSSTVGRFLNGTTLTVAWTDADGFSYSVTFTAVAAPAAQGEIPDSTFVGTSAEYWAAVAAAINGHSQVGPFFRATIRQSAGVFTLRIAAIDVSDDWTINGSNTEGFTQTNTPAQADTTPANYRARLEVFFQHDHENGLFERVAQLDGSPDGDGHLFFDLSGILNGECRRSRDVPPIPPTNSILPQKGDNLRRYYVRFTEESGSPAVPQSWTVSQMRRAVDGGISKRKFAEGQTFSGLVSELNQLLTYWPDRKMVGLDQPEFLAFTNSSTSAAQTVVVERKWYRRDSGALGGVATFFGGGFSVGPLETLLLPVGPSVVGLAGEPNAYRYTIQVKRLSDGEPLGGLRTYLLDWNFYRQKRDVLFLSSLGCPETLRCTGVFDRKLKVDSETARGILAPGFGPNAAELLRFGERDERTTTFRSGFLRRSEMDVLFDLWMSRDFWLVDGPDWQRFVLKTETFDLEDTDRELHSATFTAQPTMQLGSFSGQPPEIEEDCSGIGCMIVGSTNIVG